MGRRKRMQPNGFEEWGGYMALKKLKLQEQFSESASKVGEKITNIFKGVSIFVNGYTDPSADELRNLMMQHGGLYHHYYRTGETTYVIASNLPDSKLKQTQGIKFLKPSWITDSIKENKILDYRDYLLYTNQSKTQPGLKFFSNKVNEPSQIKSSVTKTATDKEFLSEFYSNSRLHHISTMGAMFKQYINELRNNKSHRFSGRDELLSRQCTEANDATGDLIGTSSTKVIMHIDMDCFFVSVGIRDLPHLKGVPVAVTHAKGNRAQPREGMKKELELYKQKSGRGTSSDGGGPSSHWTDTLNEFDSMAEVASCSYEARAAGVKNGMFLGQALKLCPGLKPIPYDFEAYKEVSYSLYDSVARYSLNIEAVSCDEMYVDCTEILSVTGLGPMDFATILRNEIKAKTRCPCSVGFGLNKLQARIATKKAKPDGQFILDSGVEAFFRNIPVSDLPGVGYSTSYKLKSLGVKTCGDLQLIDLRKLQCDFGIKIGETLYKNCRGIDDKELVFNQLRKSVSAEVNYGIRFQSDTERDSFLEQLSGEVSERLKSVGMKGKSITLKLMVRSKDAPEETAKFLGHGVCDHIAKSTLLSNAVSDSSTIYGEVTKIIEKLKIDPRDLRGIGIQLTRLESCTKNSENDILKFLNKQNNALNSMNDKRIKDSAVPSTSKEGPKINHRCPPSELLGITISQVDQSFMSAIPDDIRAEIMEVLNENSKTKNVHQVSKPFEFGNPISDSYSSENEEITLDGTTEEHSHPDDSTKSLISPIELKCLLVEWIENEDIPQERDISFINNYLQGLVKKCFLEELTIILKYFFRYIQRYSKGSEWKSAYEKVYEDVQAKMKSIFRGELAFEEQYTHF